MGQTYAGHLSTLYGVDVWQKFCMGFCKTKTAPTGIEVGHRSNITTKLFLVTKITTPLGYLKHALMRLVFVVRACQLFIYILKCHVRFSISRHMMSTTAANKNEKDAVNHEQKQTADQKTEVNGKEGIVQEKDKLALQVQKLEEELKESKVSADKLFLLIFRIALFISAFIQLTQ